MSLLGKGDAQCKEHILTMYPIFDDFFLYHPRSLPLNYISFMGGPFKISHNSASESKLGTVITEAAVEANKQRRSNHPWVVDLRVKSYPVLLTQRAYKYNETMDE
ncbi:unnamed protein product [Camellia sinensis]